MKRGGQGHRNGRRHGKSNNNNNHNHQSPHINTSLHPTTHPNNSFPSTSPSASPHPTPSPIPSHSPTPSLSPTPLSPLHPPLSPTATHSACDLFLRNLHPTTTAHTLHALFAPYGPIHSLRIIQTKTAPRYSREIAYLSYHLPSSASAAVEAVNGAYVDGRFVLVGRSRVMSDKRDWLFSGLDGSVRHSVQLDDVAEYSVTDSVTADTLSALLLAFVGAEATVTDACACVGGNTLSFARHFAHVQACEYDRTRFDMLNHNLALLSSSIPASSPSSSASSAASCLSHTPSVSTILASYLDVMPIWRQDATFIDPPFGADFELHPTVHPTLADVGVGELVRQLFNQSRPTRAVLLKLPRNVDWRRILRELAAADGGLLGPGGVRVNVGKVHFPKLIAVLFERELSGGEFEERLRGAAIGGVKEGVSRYVYDWEADARLNKGGGEGEERKVAESAPLHQQHDEQQQQQQQQQHEADDAFDQAAIHQQQQPDGRLLWKDVSDYSSIEPAIVEQLAASDPHVPFTPFAYARDTSSKAKKAKKKLAKKATRKDEGLTLSVVNFFSAFAAASEEETADDDEEENDDD